jgi:phage replication O-like protein O
MANPQKENGYTSIANELYDAIIKWRFSSYEYRVIIFIIRKTYGYNKKGDWISLSQFVEGTNIRRTHICRTINYLIKQNIITKGGNKEKPEYGIQKDYEKWLKLNKGERSHHSLITKGGNKEKIPKGVIEDVKGGNLVVSKGVHTKDNITKDNITKDKGTSEQSSQEIKIDPINKIFQAFYDNGNKGINFGNKTERAAANWLLKEYGLERATNTIKYAMSLQGEKYAPTITTPFQLKNNLAKLIAYYKRENTNNTIII